MEMQCIKSSILSATGHHSINGAVQYTKVSELFHMYLYLSLVGRGHSGSAKEGQSSISNSDNLYMHNCLYFTIISFAGV